MTIYLQAPAFNPSGPDGRGFNRLSLNAHMREPADRCALQPTTYASLFESHDTRRARWSDAFGRCDRQGACDGCPVMTRFRRPFTLEALDSRVLVRSDRQGRLWVVNRPEDGWGSTARLVTWDQLARLSGWTLGSQYSDEHGFGFWLERAVPAA